MKARPDIKRGQVKEWPRPWLTFPFAHANSYLMRGYVTGKLYSLEIKQSDAFTANR